MTATRTTTAATGGDWRNAIAALPRRHVLVTGGSGHLGVRLVQAIQQLGHRVTVVDTTPPRGVAARFIACDVRDVARLSPGSFDGVDAVVHLAGVHGVHLVGGASRDLFWSVNVRGTQALLEEAVRAGVQRFVFASSTSVYGSGSRSGPARVLDESTPIWPENAYDLSKAAAETLVEDAREHPIETAVCRFGRFFFGSAADHQLRKLSTGLDAHDACQAVLRILFAPRLVGFRYCVCSDLPLPPHERALLGVEPRTVLERNYPHIVEAADARGITLPERVGKSVRTEALRRDTGYQPERTLEWASRLWRAGDLLASARGTRVDPSRYPDPWQVVS